MYTLRREENVTGTFVTVTPEDCDSSTEQIFEKISKNVFHAT